jgi:hypothetical protein
MSLAEGLSRNCTDSDIYSSARTIFECLGKRIASGTVIVFDEYLNYPNWERHEHRAWQEFLVESGRRARYLALGATTSSR